MSKAASLLVVDDDAGVVSWLVDSLSEEGFSVVGETSAHAAIGLLASQTFDLVISDVEMPEMRGLDLLRAIHRERPKQMVLLITAFGSIDLAVESVRAGAVDFLAKPFRIEVLVLAIRRALRERHMRREIVRLRAASAPTDSGGVVAKSPTMLRVLDLARRSAKSDLPVLVTGESGVGKGMLAKFIHDASDRAASKFVQLNCAALPSGIAEAELFGARRGAFTDAREDRVGVFEQAHGGTLFLDEVGELPMDVQPKLLQALESNRVRPLGGAVDVPADARIVAATNRPLEDALRERRFRPDLYHRLNVIRIEIPPLRERIEDIDAIVDHAMSTLVQRSGLDPLGISAEAMKWLRAQAWPGNVRELVNAVRRAAALAEHDVLTIDDFRTPSTASAGAPEDGDDENLSLVELERRHIRRVLAKTGGHKGQAAKILGLDRRTLYKKVAEMDGDLRPDDEPL